MTFRQFPFPVEEIASGGIQMKTGRMSNKIRQYKSNLPGDLKAEIVRDRMDEFTIDGIEGMLQNGHEECFHTPDMLEPINFEDHGDAIIRISKCHCCGEMIREMFTSSG